MFTRKKTNAESVIEDIMDFCISKDIKDSHVLSKVDGHRYKDLLIAVAKNDGIEYCMSVCHIAHELFNLRFRSGDQREAVEDLIKNYADSLDSIPQLPQKINEMIEAAYEDYYEEDYRSYPSARRRGDVLDLIADDNRERARSLRGM